MFNMVIFAMSPTPWGGGGGTRLARLVRMNRFLIVDVLKESEDPNGSFTQEFYLGQFGS